MSIDERIGMSLRDYFAGQALISIMSIPLDESQHTSKTVIQWYERNANKAYRMADAMLKAREPKTDNVEG